MDDIAAVTTVKSEETSTLVTSDSLPEIREIILKPESASRLNFTHWEKELLTEIIAEYQHIIDIRRTDNVSTTMKQKAWNEIQHRYNEVNDDNKRTPKQLKTLWKNLKQKNKPRKIYTRSPQKRHFETIDIEMVAPNAGRSLENGVMLSTSSLSESDNGKSFSFSHNLIITHQVYRICMRSMPCICALCKQILEIYI